MPKIDRKKLDRIIKGIGGLDSHKEECLKAKAEKFFQQSDDRGFFSTPGMTKEEVDKLAKELKDNKNDNLNPEEEDDIIERFKKEV